MGSSHRLKELIKRYKGRCVYCKEEVVHSAANPFMPMSASCDHFLPLIRGGNNEPANLVLSCFRCNQMKGALNPYEWEQFFALFGPDNIQRVMAEIVALNEVEV